MAWRLKLVPEKTDWDFFQWQWLTFGASIAAVLASIVLVLVMGLNFGIDFKGGTTIRTDSAQLSMWVPIGPHLKSSTWAM